MFSSLTGNKEEYYISDLEIPHRKNKICRQICLSNSAYRFVIKIIIKDFIENDDRTIFED